MTAKWIQVYLRQKNETWCLSKEPTQFVETDQATILASGDQIALTPCDDKYLMGGSNHYNLEGYKTVTAEDIFKIEDVQIFMQCHIDEQQITPTTLAGKVIIKWKN